MKIHSEGALIKLKPKFSAEKSKKISQSKQKLSDYSSDDTANESLCSKDAAKKYVKYYLQNTTLHGLKYIAEDKITVPERILTHPVFGFSSVFFGLAFVVVVIISGFFISNIYVKWSASPIIISTSAKQTFASDVPFPAVTICNLNQASKSKVESISEQSSNFSLLMSLCDQTGDRLNYMGTWKNFKAILTAVAQPCDEMLLYCRFGARAENCSVIFNSVLTDDGLCCTFNALDPVYLLRNFSEENRLYPPVLNHYTPMDWTPEKGFNRDLPKNYYPRVSGGTGSRMGLTVVLNSSSSEYYCTKSKSIGFKVLVHNPAELPKISNYGFLVTAGREARIPIEPVYEDAAPSIRSIKKNVRRCLFSDEGDLTYYRTYSRKNCELECEARILMEKCDCVLYYLPRIDPQTRICGPKDNACTNEVQTQIESSDKNVSCANCWPACFELNYQVTLTSTTIVYGSFISTDEFPPGLFNDSTEITDLSVLYFYYLSNTFRSTTKSEMFGFTEFLSNTGGLLGLFMGFSIFSLIEIVYYITVRPYCANRTLELSRRRRHEHIKTNSSFHWATTVKSKFKPTKYDGSSRFWANEKSHKKIINNKNYRNNLRNILMQQHKLNNDDTPAPVYPYLE